jgi:hypothetical protein
MAASDGNKSARVAQFSASLWADHTSRECREQAERFAARSLEGGISVRRATLLMAIADSWSRLAGQIDRLETLQAGEKP